MNRQDRARWAACETLAQVGDCVADWLTGGIEACPGHEAPPDPETTPYVMLLCGVNRRGLVTLMMDDGDICQYSRKWEWGPAVWGVITPARASRLAFIAERHGCEVVPMPRRRSFLSEWRGMVQDSAYAEMRAARCVLVADPVRGRSGRDSPLWAALREFAR